MIGAAHENELVNDGSAAKIVDCRNQLCPKPVFMVKEALSQAKLGERFEVIVNDDGSKQNVLRYCWNHGQEVTRSFADGSDFHILLTRSVEKKVDNPLPAIGPCGARWE